MEYGVHLPLMPLADRQLALPHLLEYAKTAERLGFRALAANDHLVYARPWLDGLVALAAVAGATERMQLMTTVALPVVRGPVVLAKGLAAIDLLSGGRLIAAVGAGSSPRDYAAVGIPFEERWQRLEEAVPALRALWFPDRPPFQGRFYRTDGLVLQPGPAQQLGPPLWIGTWGSDAGLRRTARLGDGWLGSAYNTTPAAFAAAWTQLRTHLQAAGKDPALFPNALATMFLYITEDAAAAERVVSDVLSPVLNREASELRPRLLVGSAQECAEKIAAYQAAGAQRLLVWPVGDALHQLVIFQERVASRVPA
jgi:probable F420-dependent oxidoreductase